MLAFESGIPERRIARYRRDPQRELSVETVRGLLEAAHGLWWHALRWRRARRWELAELRDQIVKLLGSALEYPRSRTPAEWDAEIAANPYEPDAPRSLEPLPSRVPTPEERRRIELIVRQSTSGEQCHKELAELVKRGSLTLQLPRRQFGPLEPFGFWLVSADEDGCVVHIV